MWIVCHSGGLIQGGAVGERSLVSREEMQTSLRPHSRSFGYRFVQSNPAISERASMRAWVPLRPQPLAWTER